MIQKLVLLLLSIILCISVPTYIGCKNSTQYKTPMSEMTCISNGVILTGVLVDNCTINNTNDFDVRIRCVWQFRGETTQWIRILKSKDVITLRVTPQHGFYIQTLEGVNIGFLHIDAYR